MAISREDSRKLLPEELWSVFDQLVEEYRYHSTVIHGRPFVSYAVLAGRERWLETTTISR